jgi:hypothetical protein
MNYQQKYLKYKQKYLELKKIIGGNALTYDALKRSCKTQQGNDPYNNCSNCYYMYPTTKRPDGFLENHKDINGNDIPGRFKSYRACNAMDNIESYFNSALRTNIMCHNDKMPVQNMPVQNLVLDSQRYHNIENIDQTRLVKYPSDIDTLCAEGNVVWVNANSKVGSTKVDSCMFVILILNDNSKICIHHVLSDDEESHKQMRGTDDITHMMYSGNDAIWDNLETITSGSLQRAYLCGSGVNTVEYQKLQQKYIDIFTAIGFYDLDYITEDKHYLINNDNKLISWN